MRGILECQSVVACETSSRCSSGLIEQLLLQQLQKNQQLLSRAPAMAALDEAPVVVAVFVPCESVVRCARDGTDDTADGTTSRLTCVAVSLALSASFTVHLFVVVWPSGCRVRLNCCSDEDETCSVPLLCASEPFRAAA